MKKFAGKTVVLKELPHGDYSGVSFKEAIIDLTGVSKIGSEYKFDRADFSGAEFKNGNFEAHNVSFKGADFSFIKGGSIFIEGKSCNFQGADFSGTIFRAFFEDCNFRGSKFVKADLREGGWKNCVLKGSDFQGASLIAWDDYTFFEGCNLQNVNFSSCKFGQDFYFDSNDYKGADFKNTDVHKVYDGDPGSFILSQAKKLPLEEEVQDYENADLEDRGFDGVDFVKVSFRNANLSHMNFNYCTFKECDLRFGSIWNTDFKSCDFRGAKHPIPLMPKWSAYNCDFSNISFSFASKGNGEDGQHLEGCDFSNTTFKKGSFLYLETENCNFNGADLRGTNIFWEYAVGSSFKNADFSGAVFHDSFPLFNLERIDLTGANLQGVRGIPLEASDSFSHKGETVEEEARRKEEEARRKEEEARRKEEEARRKEEEEARERTIKDITKRVSRAKKDKELEQLAVEVGSLQAQPEYVQEYRPVLEELQETIENKYSLVGKGIRYLKRLFSKGRRASQIRTASQMNREIQREIKALKRDLNK